MPYCWWWKPFFRRETSPHYGKLSDVELLTLAGGAERTAGEWAALLAAGGFRIDRTVPAGGVVSILEAVAV
jgi:hypothetical protein